jgi:AcrR family transcriptional regulator
MTDTAGSTRDRIVRAAADLLARGGRDAVSTRSVAAAAGVQAPTIYRQFGDMRGLLDAVVSYGFAVYLEDKRSQARAEDPVEDLRRGWDFHVEFGLANPALYGLMYGDPRPGAEFAAAAQAMQILQELVRRVAEAGRLRVGVTRAARMLHAACRGVALDLLGEHPDDRDPTLSVQVREAMLDAVMVPVDTSAAAETTATAQGRRSLVSSRAVALSAVLPEVTRLTLGERSLLSEWLDKLSQPDT